MHGLLIGSIALLLAVSFGVSSASSQTPTILSQISYCNKGDATSPNFVQCRFNVLIIDPSMDRRVSCDFAMGMHYQPRTTPPFPRWVNPVLSSAITAVNCFVQPGLGIPHTSITDISSRLGGRGATIQSTSLSANAYMMYTPTKITFCMNAGSVLSSLASETVCKDANIQPF